MSSGEPMTYVAGAHGCSLAVKAGSSLDPVRRMRSLAESRTSTPLACRHRPMVLLAAWTEDQGPTEADLLAEFEEHRWRARTGRASEWLLTTPPVRSWLDAFVPGWADFLAHDPAGLRPLLIGDTR